MKAEIKFSGFNSRQELKNFVYEKANTLIRIYREFIDSEIFLQLDNSPTIEKKLCEIRLAISGNDFNARTRSK